MNDNFVILIVDTDNFVILTDDTYTINIKFVI